MIESIDLDGSRIEMPAQPSDGGAQFRIFKADSMNVIIGNNGSGKTRALRRIAMAMSTEGESLGCQINFANHEKTATAIQRYGAIYYTSIPYPVSLPQGAPRFRNASLDFSSSNFMNNVDIEQFAHLSGTLKMKTRPLVTMSCDIGLVLPMLARAAVRCISQGEVNPAKLADVFPVDEIMRNVSGTLKALGLPYGRPTATAEIKKRRVNENSLDVANQICKNILSLVRTRLGEHDLPALSAVEAVAEGRNDLTAVSIVFFNEILGIDLGRASRFLKVENEIRERLQHYLRAKIEIFDEGKPWDRSEQSGTLSIRTEYQNSGILARKSIGAFDNVVAIEWENFSSGQLALLYQFTAIRRVAKELHDDGATSLLILIDEGDIFLHASWQQRYIELLDDFIGKLRKEFGFSGLQLILTTHSPTVITDIPSRFIVRLSRDNAQQPPILSFAAAPQDIVNSSLNSDSIGSFAEKILSKTAKNIQKKGVTARDEYIISLIDDPIIKNEFKRLCSNYRYLNRQPDQPAIEES